MRDALYVPLEGDDKDGRPCRSCGRRGGPWCMCWLCEDCIEAPGFDPLSHEPWCPDASNAQVRA